ncbi:MAG: hypothetical protein ACR2PT_18040 [Endozoicomonas sp.]
MAITAAGQAFYQNYLKPALQKLTSVFRHRKVRVLSKEELPESPLGQLPPTETPNPDKRRSATPVNIGPLMPRPYVPKDPSGKFLKTPGTDPINIPRFMADIDYLDGKVKASRLPDDSEIETAASLLDAAKRKDWPAVHTHLQKLSGSWHEDLTRLLHTASKLANPDTLDEITARPIADFMPAPNIQKAPLEPMTEEEVAEAFDEFILARNPRIKEKIEPEPRAEPQTELEIEPPEPLIEPETTTEAVAEPPLPPATPKEVDLIDWLSPPEPGTNISSSSVTLRSLTGETLILPEVSLDSSFGDLLAEWAWNQNLQLSSMPSCKVGGKEVLAEEKLRSQQTGGSMEITVETLPTEHQDQLKSSIGKLLPAGTNSFIPAGRDSTESLDWAVLNFSQQAKNAPSSLSPEAIKKLQQILTGANQSLGHIPTEERQLAGQYLNRLLSLLEAPAKAATEQNEQQTRQSPVVGEPQPRPQSSRAMILLYNRNRPLVEEFLPRGKWFEYFIENEPGGHLLSLLPEATIQKAFEDEVRLYHRHFGQPLSRIELARILVHCVNACIPSSQRQDSTGQLREKLLNKRWQARKSPYQPVETPGAIAFRDPRLKKYETPVNTSHQFMLNIHPLDLERAWPLVARIITREDSPFISWQCHLPDPKKLGDAGEEVWRFGGQFTLQSLDNVRKTRFSDQRIAKCLAEIHTVLNKNNIRTGVLRDSDIPIPEAPYVGYRYALDSEDNQHEPAQAVDEARKLEYRNQPCYQTVSSYLASGI